MARFSNAQAGDEVYCRLYGDGTFTSFTEGQYPITVSFDNGHINHYSRGGHVNKTYIEPTLFYRKGDERYLTERPEPETDWSKVPRGTMVRVWDDGKDKIIRQIYDYAPEMAYPFIVMNDSGHLYAYKNAELIKESA